MPQRIPIDAYAMIVGAMKCGTTSLYSYLKRHPEICPAISKEPEFFSENQGHGEDVDDYSNLWAFDASIHKYALEASTGYTKYPLEPNVPKRIRDYGIKPKFIYIIRNPFDRIVSHINFLKYKNLRLDNDPAGLVSTSNYFLQMEQYRKYFPAADILILDFDELRDNPRQLLQRTYRFLGLSRSRFPKIYKVRNPAGVDSGLENKPGRLKLGVFFRHVGPLIKARKARLRESFPSGKRMLTDLEKELVYNRLKADMVRLQHTYGFDVGKWGF